MGPTRSRCSSVGAVITKTGRFLRRPAGVVRRRSVALALLIPMIVAAHPRVVSAQAITFTKIVDTNTAIPGGSGNFEALRVFAGDI
ncbi:MAG: hypothetical protein O7B26_09920, partial [Planctomycetota bacterium]|nr:hypothetical protein [Planctomycetota bacterium]